MHATDRAAFERVAIHDGGVKLMRFRAGVHRAAPRVEQRTILQQGNDQRCRVERRSPRRQRVAPLFEEGPQGPPIFLFRFRGQRRPVDRARAAMQRQNGNPCHSNHLSGR